MRFVYLDHAATTPTDPEVVKEMLPCFTESFGNPSTLYKIGREAKKAITLARDKVAVAIGAKSEEIIFTSGGTESDNFALKGVAFANEQKGKHIITSSVEHHAVLETCKFLAKNGFEITYLPVDKYGIVDPEDVRKAVTDKTILVSVMQANNEVGTIEPIAETGKIVKEKGIYFHTDAVQAIGAVPVNVNDLNVDLLALSAHKFYGPKGVGALYIRKGTRMMSLINGGHQERRRRAGTENVPGIVGLGKAIELAVSKMEERSKQLTFLRDKLINGILDNIENVRLNGHPEKRLPNNANFSFEFVEGESMLLNLDLVGVAVSSGSACTSDTLEPSHVLSAMKVPIEIAHGSVRFTLGKNTTEEDIDYVLEVLPPIIKKLRQMSPLREGLDLNV
ncbi:MAG: cysteine desulfurase NifS [Actinobacteria bacterium]|nr:cysteine desulfurase NifS [Actinomycetota bacterium]